MKPSEIIANNEKPSCTNSYFQPGACCAWGALIEYHFPELPSKLATHLKPDDLEKPNVLAELLRSVNYVHAWIDKEINDKYVSSEKLDKILSVRLGTYEKMQNIWSHSSFQIFDIVLYLNDRLKLDKKTIATILKDLGW
jgi:hypothetical protein